MKEQKTVKVNGYFSVRKYMPNVPLKEQQIIEEGGQIAFIASLDQEPAMGEPQEYAELRAYGTPYEYKGKNHGDMIRKVRVKIKIGRYCEWFNPKPANAELENKRYTAAIKYVVKEKDPSKPLSPSGLWANAIAIRELKSSNSFESNPFGDEPQEAIPAPTQKQAAPWEQESQGTETELPF